MECAIWSSKVVREHIKTKYSISYSRSAIRKIMSQLGFLAQKPIKLAYERDPKSGGMAFENVPKNKRESCKGRGEDLLGGWNGTAVVR